MKTHRRCPAALLRFFLLTAMLWGPIVSAKPLNTGWQRISQEGDGFLVWESNRSGRWRIWTRKLDGSALRQLSRDEKDTRDHFCPHISPDGKHILYLSFPETNVYKDPGPDQKIQMRVIGPDGKRDREILGNVIHGNFGNRAACWIDSDRFTYIGRDGHTRIYSLTTGKSTRPMTLKGERYLLGPTLQYACDRFYFHPYDREARTVFKTGQKLGGCEPYYTYDGRWGIRVSGAGGPISRVDLATGDVHTLLQKNDKRMPADRAYVYFPMISRCGRLFAFGASPNQHHHFQSDYDIFVTPIDPLTLEFRDTPVRYTFDGKTDRYPDVHLGEPALGTYIGEAPFKVAFPTRHLKGRNAAWTWDYGNGTQDRKAECTYTEPGQYSVSASRGDRRLHARVDVRAAAAPVLTSAALTRPDRILLRFNEPVDSAALTATLRSGIRVASTQAGDDDAYAVTLTLSAPLTADDALTLSGISDRAQRPNIMPDTTSPIGVLHWPIALEHCVWVWQTGRKNALPKEIAGTVEARARARYTHNYALDTFGGAFDVQDANDTLLNAFKGASGFTLEATLTPDRLDPQGPARIISFSRDARQRNFTLGQQGGQLVLRLRTPATGVNGARPEQTLMPITAGETTHVVVTYTPGKLVAYKNGQAVKTSHDIQGGFSTWAPMHFVIGDEWDGGRPWEGVVEGVALYTAALTAPQIKRSFAAYQALRAERPPVTHHRGKARLVARSEAPTLAQITPYDEGLAMYEFVMVESTSDELPPGKRFRAAAWVWLSREPCPMVNVPLNTVMDINVTLKEANPQLKSLYVSETLDFNPDVLDQYYLVRP